MKHYLKVVNSQTGEEKNYSFDSLTEMKEAITSLNKELSEEYEFYIANEKTLNQN